MRGLCLVALLLLPWTTRAAPPGSANALPSLSKDDADKALRAFRNSGLSCDLVIRFELKHLPRTGNATNPEKGTLWMSWKHGFPAVRIEMGNTRFLMVRRNSESLLWQYRDNVVSKVSGSDALKPLITGYLFAHLIYRHRLHTGKIRFTNQRSVTAVVRSICSSPRRPATIRPPPYALA